MPDVDDGVGDPNGFDIDGHGVVPSATPGSDELDVTYRAPPGGPDCGGVSVGTISWMTTRPPRRR